MDIRTRVISLCTLKAPSAPPQPKSKGALEALDLAASQELFIASIRKTNDLDDSIKVQRGRMGRGPSIATYVASAALVGAGVTTTALGVPWLGIPLMLFGGGIGAARYKVVADRKTALQDTEDLRRVTVQDKKAAYAQFRAKVAQTEADPSALKALAAHSVRVADWGRLDELRSEVLSHISKVSPNSVEGAVAFCAVNNPLESAAWRLAVWQRAVALKLIADGVGGGIGAGLSDYAAKARPNDDSKKTNCATDLLVLKQIVEKSGNPNEQFLARVARNARKRMPDKFKAPAAFMDGALSMIGNGVSPDETSTHLLSRYALSQIGSLDEDGVYGFSRAVLDAIKSADSHPNVVALANTAQEICDVDAPKGIKRIAIKSAFEKLQHGVDDTPTHKMLAWYGTNLTVLPEAANGAARESLYAVMRNIAELTNGETHSKADTARLKSADTQSRVEASNILTHALRQIIEQGEVAPEAHAAGTATA